MVEGGLGVVARLGVVLWLWGRCCLCRGLEEDGCEDVKSVVMSKRFLFCHDMEDSAQELGSKEVMEGDTPRIV